MPIIRTPCPVHPVLDPPHPNLQSPHLYPLIHRHSTHTLTPPKVQLQYFCATLPPSLLTTLQPHHQSSPQIHRNSMSSQFQKPRRTSTVVDPYATPAVYYGESHSKRHLRARTYSVVSLLFFFVTVALSDSSQHHDGDDARNSIVNYNISGSRFHGRRASHGT